MSKRKSPYDIDGDSDEERRINVGKISTEAEIKERKRPGDVQQQETKKEKVKFNLISNLQTVQNEQPQENEQKEPVKIAQKPEKIQINSEEINQLINSGDQKYSGLFQNKVEINKNGEDSDSEKEDQKFKEKKIKIEPDNLNKILNNTEQKSSGLFTNNSKPQNQEENKNKNLFDEQNKNIVQNGGQQTQIFNIFAGQNNNNKNGQIFQDQKQEVKPEKELQGIQEEALDNKQQIVNQQQQKEGGGLFKNINVQGQGIFNTNNIPTTGGLFGNSQNNGNNGGLFSNIKQSGGLFSNSNNIQGGLFSQVPVSSGLFGQSNQTSLFGGLNQQNQSSSLFGGQSALNLVQKQDEDGEEEGDDQEIEEALKKEQELDTDNDKSKANVHFQYENPFEVLLELNVNKIKKGNVDAIEKGSITIERLKQGESRPYLFVYRNTLQRPLINTILQDKLTRTDYFGGKNQNISLKSIEIGDDKKPKIAQLKIQFQTDEDGKKFKEFVNEIIPCSAQNQTEEKK